MKNTMEQPKTFTHKEHVDMLKSMIFVSLISADNDEYTEDIKQEVLKRHKIASKGFDSILDNMIDWAYVLEPLGKDAEKYRKIMEAV